MGARAGDATIESAGPDRFVRSGPARLFRSGPARGRLSDGRRPSIEELGGAQVVNEEPPALDRLTTVTTVTKPRSRLRKRGFRRSPLGRPVSRPVGVRMG